MATGDLPADPADPADKDTDDAPDTDESGLLDDVELEPNDVAVPGNPEFDDTNEPLTGVDADPPPGAEAG